MRYLILLMFNLDVSYTSLLHSQVFLFQKRSPSLCNFLISALLMPEDHFFQYSQFLPQVEEKVQIYGLGEGLWVLSYDTIIIKYKQ